MVMRILDGHSDRPNSEGRKNIQLMKKQSQESQSKTQVKMDPESEGFTDLSNCRKQLEWDEVMRILEASLKGHIMLSYE